MFALPAIDVYTKGPASIYGSKRRLNGCMKRNTDMMPGCGDTEKTIWRKGNGDNNEAP